MSYRKITGTNVRKPFGRQFFGGGVDHYSLPMNTPSPTRASAVPEIRRGWAPIQHLCQQKLCKVRTTATI
eukprot:4222833-Pyramimonas_sp.AAC.1